MKTRTVAGTAATSDTARAKKLRNALIFTSALAVIVLLTTGCLSGFSGPGGAEKEIPDGGEAARIAGQETEDSADQAGGPAEAEPEEPAAEAPEPIPDTESYQSAPPDSPAPDISYSGDFFIEGKWKNIGETEIGQAQSGAIIVFDGMYCNLISPRDTYAFYKNGSDYMLDWTTLLGSSGSNTVHVIDENHMEIYSGDRIIEFQRAG